MKRKDNNWFGILSDQREAATSEKLSEYTILKLPAYLEKVTIIPT